jgi:phenylacetate-CoA ligase
LPIADRPAGNPAFPVMASILENVFPLLLWKSLLRPGLAHLFVDPRDAAQRLSMQARQLRWLVRHAGDNVPFYQDLFREAGFDWRQLRSQQDMAGLPLLRRPQIQAATPASRIARGFALNDLLARNTSGTTGEPIRIYRTPYEDAFLQAISLRHNMLTGYRPWHKRVGFALLNRARPKGAAQPITKEKRRSGLFHFEGIDIATPAEEALAILERVNPELIGGLTSPVFDLCAELGPERLRSIRPQRILCGGETMLPHMRKTIVDVLGAPIYELYGAHETNNIAWEAPGLDGFRVSLNTVFLEVLRDGKPVAPGETGEAFITALCSYASPIIRFSLGDLVTRHPQDTAHPTVVTRISRIAGRVTQRLLLQDGTSRDSYEIIVPVLKSFPEMLHYQIAQTELDLAEIRIKLPEGFDAAERTARERKVLDMAGGSLGRDFQIHFSYPERMERTPAGKFAVFTSRPWKQHLEKQYAGVAAPSGQPQAEDA